MAVMITAQHLESFQRDGYVVVNGLVGADDLLAMRMRIDEVQAECRRSAVAASAYSVHQEDAAVAAAPLRKLTDLARNDPLFRRMAALPAILAAVDALTAAVGGKILLYTDQAFLKPAFHGSPKPLHQDNSYFAIQPFEAGITCWIAIDDATVDNGCMRYIPGSHKLGLVKHRSISSAHLTPDTDVPLGEEIPVPVPAGSCIFHHVCALHASKANTTANPRRAWAVHYAKSGAQHCAKPFDQMLVLGASTASSTN
jgi:ectoine hydroxylase-related dioxygenase (phytanoyl-CoA dioxygenase family)